MAVGRSLLRPGEARPGRSWASRQLPGLASLWQVSGRNQVDFDRRMALDLEYIDN